MLAEVKSWLKQKRCTHAWATTITFYGKDENGVPSIVRSCRCPDCGAAVLPLAPMSGAESVRLLKIAEQMKPGQHLKWPEQDKHHD